LEEIVIQVVVPGDAVGVTCDADGVIHVQASTTVTLFHCAPQTETQYVPPSYGILLIVVGVTYICGSCKSKFTGVAPILTALPPIYNIPILFIFYIKYFSF
jgi:hypothetical protein